jgi:hypothetical protein
VVEAALFRVELVGPVAPAAEIEGLAFLVILLDAGTLVVDVQQGITPSVMTRVRKAPGVAWVMLRSKISCTCLGRPRSRFSRITCSKKILLLTGRSSTCVKDSSICQRES